MPGTSKLKFNRLSDLAAAGQLKGKRVFIRADLNVPQDEAGQRTLAIEKAANATVCSFFYEAPKRFLNALTNLNDE